MTWDPPPAPPSWGQPPAGPAPLAFGPPPPAAAPQYAPDRGALILILGILGLVVMFFGCALCGPLALGALGLSVPAIVMGKRDLEQIRAGQMNPGGRDLTMVGFVLGITGAVIALLITIFYIVIFVFYGAIIGAALLAAPPPQ